MADVIPCFLLFVVVYLMLFIINVAPKDTKRSGVDRLIRLILAIQTVLATVHILFLLHQEQTGSKEIDFVLWLADIKENTVIVELFVQH